MKKTLFGIAGIVVGVTIVAAGGFAWAARGGTGTYTLPAGNPVYAGNTVTSSWANTTLADIASALSDSLSRSGRGGMTAPLQLINGTASAPSLAWTSSPTTGFWRPGADNVCMSIANNSASECWSISTQTVNNNLTINGSSSIAGNATVSGTFGVGGAFTVSGNTRFLNPVSIGASVTPSSGNSALIIADAVAGRDSVAQLGTTNPLLLLSGSGTPPFSPGLGFNVSNLAGTETYVSSGTHYAGTFTQEASTGDFVFSTAGTGTNPSVAALTERLRIRNAGTVAVAGALAAGSITGTVNANGGVTIGSGGTAISASFRGTAFWQPCGGGCSAGQNVYQPITLTGAVAGADCVVTTPTTYATTAGLIITCAVSANTCTIQVKNITGGFVATSSETYACRVFNP